MWAETGRDAMDARVICCAFVAGLRRDRGRRRATGRQRIWAQFRCIMVGMTKVFSPRLDVLPPSQRRLWDELAAVPLEFVLYGGTAIALQLGHRHAVGFDVFGNRALDAMRLVPAVPFLDGATVTKREPNSFSCLVDRGGVVKLSFFGLPGIPRLLPPLIAPDNGLRIASLLDLAGMKASVVQMRAEAKDYLDIDAMLTDGRIDLPMALASARAIYGAAFNPLATLKALA